MPKTDLRYWAGVARDAAIGLVFFFGLMAVAYGALQTVGAP